MAERMALNAWNLEMRRPGGGRFAFIKGSELLRAHAEVKTVYTLMDVDGTAWFEIHHESLPGRPLAGIMPVVDRNLQPVSERPIWPEDGSAQTGSCLTGT
jgi:hypothetical protein